MIIKLLFFNYIVALKRNDDTCFTVLFDQINAALVSFFFFFLIFLNVLFVLL